MPGQSLPQAYMAGKHDFSNCRLYWLRLQFIRHRRRQVNNPVSGRNILSVAGILAFALGSGAALAESGNPAVPGQDAEDMLIIAQADEAASSRLSIEQVVTRLEADGFRVHGIELDDGRYEVDAIDASENRVELEVDPETGEILRNERDD
jgi:hypothetical protein